jgi:hypothetical protein
MSEDLDAQPTLTVLADAVDNAAGPLARLRALQDLLDAATAASAQAVSAARADGTTWQEVGGALGISRQAAQQRYGRRTTSSTVPTPEAAPAGASGAPTSAPPTSAKATTSGVTFDGWSLLLRFRRHSDRDVTGL